MQESTGSPTSVWHCTRPARYCVAAGRRSCGQLAQQQLSRTLHCCCPVCAADCAELAHGAAGSSVHAPAVLQKLDLVLPRHYMLNQMPEWAPWPPNQQMGQRCGGCCLLLLHCSQQGAPLARARTETPHILVYQRSVEHEHPVGGRQGLSRTLTPS